MQYGSRQALNDCCGNKAGVCAFPCNLLNHGLALFCPNKVRCVVSLLPPFLLFPSLPHPQQVSKLTITLYDLFVQQCGGGCRWVGLPTWG